MHIPIGFSIYHNLLLRHPYLIGVCVCVYVRDLILFLILDSIRSGVRDYIQFPFKFHIHLYNHLISSFKSFTLTENENHNNAVH